MGLSNETDLRTLRPDQPFFERVYTASPLVIVGTREPDGSPNLAPKHMAMPLGTAGHFGFVCTPEHATFRNVERTGAFTVNYPRPESILDVTLAAAPREAGGEKPSLRALDTVEVDEVDGFGLVDAYGILECEVDRVVSGFGKHELIIGGIVAKHVDDDVYRGTETEPEEVLAHAPVLAYLYPDRFASIEESQAFPFPEGFEG